jgi:flagellar biosynthesis protein FlhG
MKQNSIDSPVDPKDGTTGPKVIAVGGGKGGVGKTVITASMGLGLAMMNRRVILVDVDLGGANLHTVFGVSRPEATFFNIVGDQTARLGDLAIPHPEFENLKCVFGAAGSLEVSNLRHPIRMKILRQLRTLDADFVILDLGAGSSNTVLEFFNGADYGIVVMNPDPLSILESYNFIKLALFQRLIKALRKSPAALERVKAYADAETNRNFTTVSDLEKEVAKTEPGAEKIVSDIATTFHPLLLMNKRINPEDESHGLAVKVAASELLSLTSGFLGSIRKDQIVMKSLEAGVPFIQFDPKCEASRDLANLIIVKILYQGKIKALIEKTRMSRRPARPEMPQAVTICSIRCFFWDECEYKSGGFSCKLHHLSSIKGFNQE